MTQKFNFVGLEDGPDVDGPVVAEKDVKGAGWGVEDQVWGAEFRLARQRKLQANWRLFERDSGMFLWSDIPPSLNYMIRVISSRRESIESRAKMSAHR